MTVKPLSPDEALQEAAAEIPDFVVETFNQLLKEKAANGRVVLAQATIMEALEPRLPAGVSRADVFSKGWLNVETLYGGVGWIVKYEAAERDSSAYFTFTRKPRPRMADC